MNQRLRLHPDFSRSGEHHEPLMEAVSRTRADTIEGLAQQEFSNIVYFGL